MNLRSPLHILLLQNEIENCAFPGKLQYVFHNSQAISLRVFCCEGWFFKAESSFSVSSLFCNIKKKKKKKNMENCVRAFIVFGFSCSCAFVRGFLTRPELRPGLRMLNDPGSSPFDVNSVHYRHRRAETLTSLLFQRVFPPSLSASPYSFLPFSLSHLRIVFYLSRKRGNLSYRSEDQILCDERATVSWNPPTMGYKKRRWDCISKRKRDREAWISLACTERTRISQCCWNELTLFPFLLLSRLSSPHLLNIKVPRIVGFRLECTLPRHSSLLHALPTSSRRTIYSRDSSAVFVRLHR